MNVHPSPPIPDQPLKVSVEPGRDVLVLNEGDAFSATVRVPVLLQVPAGSLPRSPLPAQPAVFPEGYTPPVATAPSPTPTSTTSTSLPPATDPTPTPSPTSTYIDPASLPDDVKVLKQMLIDVLGKLKRERQDREELQRSMDALLHKLNHPRPQAHHPDQGWLFTNIDTTMSTSGSETVTPPITPPIEPTATPDAEPKRKCKPHGRKRPPDHLRREPRRHELTQAERLCPDCGTERCEIGVETTSQYEYKPAEIFVIEHQQVKYACPCCQGHVATAEKPPQPIDKGLPGPGLLAQIIEDKYLYHLPLHRTEQRFFQLGAPIHRSTMCDWMAASAELMTPLCHKLKEWVLMSAVIHTDDTTVPVFDPQLDERRYGRLWPYIGDSEHPGIVFEYTPTRKRDGPAEFLKGYQGFLQADAYGGYDGIYLESNGKIKEAGCWAHARMHFDEAESSDPQRVLTAKAYIRLLCDVEDEAKEMSAAERVRLRQEKSVPTLTSLRQWLLEQQPLVLPKSPMASAIRYVLNQWEALVIYTTNGALSIDNNLAERTLKLIGMGRDNWLFVGSDKGGETAAILYSFTATCKQLKIDTNAYLRDVLARLPTHPADRLEELLPHRWQASREASKPASTRPL